MSAFKMPIITVISGAERAEMEEIEARLKANMPALIKALEAIDAKQRAKAAAKPVKRAAK